MELFDGQLSFTDIYENIPIAVLDDLYEARVKLLEEKAKRQEEAMRAASTSNDSKNTGTKSILPPT